MKTLTEKNKKEIKELIKQLPKSVVVSAIPCDEGGYTAKLIDFKGAITEADNFWELMGMVNALILDWFEVPEKYTEFMPEFMPPISLAKKLNEFPTTAKVLRGEFSLAV